MTLRGGATYTLLRLAYGRQETFKGEKNSRGQYTLPTPKLLHYLKLFKIFSFRNLNALFLETTPDFQNLKNTTEK